MTAKSPEDDDRLVEDIYDALDEGAPERALASARIALHDAPDDPVLHFLAASRCANWIFPPKPSQNSAVPSRRIPTTRNSSRSRRGVFAMCRFGEAKADAESALATEIAQADALWVLGLVLEREGRLKRRTRSSTPPPASIRSVFGRRCDCLATRLPR